MSVELSSEETARVDEALKNCRKTSAVSPSSLSEETGIGLRKVIKRLNDLVVARKVSVTHEIDCPNCDRSVRTSDKNQTRNALKCAYCGTTFEPKEDEIWTSYRVQNG